MFWCEEWLDFPVCLRNLLTRDLMQNQDVWSLSPIYLSIVHEHPQPRSSIIMFSSLNPWASTLTPDWVFLYIYTRSFLVSLIYSFFFYIYNPGFPGQFMRTTTNSQIHWTTYKLSVHVKHYEGDRYVQRELNPDTEKKNKSLIYSSLWVIWKLCWFLWLWF
jgi:hypothetical protein